MTRRDLFLLPFAALPGAMVASASDFWNDRKPEDWTEPEVNELLTKSPWAKEASVSVFGGAGGSLINRNGAMNRQGNMSGSGRQRTSTTQNAPSADTPDLRYRAIMRWDSALPIRQALKTKTDTWKDFYILALVGDLALADSDEDAAQRESRLDMMKQYTRLEKKGNAISLSNVETVKKVGTMFYFQREEQIKDGQVTFVTKMGPVEVKCKFTVKEMMYRGKLEL